MKKFILVLILCLCAGSVRAANMIDTLGAECGRILFNMEEHQYPDRFDLYKDRNSQLKAFNLCINTYKENNGDINELNQRYYRARRIYDSVTLDCFKESDEKRKEGCSSLAKFYFDLDLKLSIEELYMKYKNLSDTTINLPQNTIIDLIKIWIPEDKLSRLEAIKNKNEKNP